MTYGATIGSMTTTFFILLNVAVSGYLPGMPDDTTIFPQTMLVDYVRVYQLATNE
jgi:beta-glucanase (GH16 family)